MTERTDDKWIYGRRKDIASVETSEHAGLWFDKYLSQQLRKGVSLGKDDSSPYKKLVDAVSGIPESEAYTMFFKRWQTQIETMRVAIDSCEYRVIARPARAQGRIALGLGDESVIETAVTLHHTYGAPYIPGSALKGLAAAYAHRMLEGDTWRKARYQNGKLLKKAGDAHTTMFGTTSSAGYVVFFDALYVPKSGHKGKPLWPDVITVHHPDYYQEKKRDGKLAPPADWDSPTPVPFLTATGTYLIALGGPLTWVNLAFKLLGHALVEMGVGAKTSSGYGRLILDGLDIALERKHSAAASQPQKVLAETRAGNLGYTHAAPHVPDLFVQGVTRSDKGSLPNMIGQWRALPADIRVAAAHIMIERALQIKVKNLETKSWYQELQQAIADATD